MYGEGISLSGEIVDLGVECNVIKKAVAGSRMVKTNWAKDGKR